MTSLTVGKIRRLQQCATSRGVFSILAIDHRNNLRRALNPQDPSAVSDDALVDFKRAVVAALATESSSILIDPEYGATPVITSGALPGAIGLIVALERTGYTGSPSSRLSELLPEWSPQRVARLGASGVKLLVYYHPDAPTVSRIETLVEQVGALCLEVDIPLFLEPLSYSPDPAQPRLLPQERRRVVIETARRLTSIPGVDVLKAEFPLDIGAVPNEAEWLAACQELTESSRVPWVLLSAGVDFETYLRQVAAAVRAGASGVAVGRAVWKEAVELAPEERNVFLFTVARERMARATELCQALAHPWTDFHSPPAMESHWYEDYP
jgi:tagatose 1,6-diphosphate aldolase